MPMWRWWEPWKDIASHWWSVFGIWCEARRRRRCQIVKLSNTSIWRQQTGGNHLMIIEAPVLRQNWICEITFNSQWGGGHYIAWWWGGILMARLFNDFIPPPLLPNCHVWIKSLGCYNGLQCLSFHVCEALYIYGGCSLWEERWMQDQWTQWTQWNVIEALVWPLRHQGPLDPKQ